MLVSRNVWTHSCLSSSASCHGVVARGCILSVLGCMHSDMHAIQVQGVFLFCLQFPWGDRCVGSSGVLVGGSFGLCSWGILAIMGWSSFRHDSQSASMSILYSRYRSIGGMDISISIAIVGVVLKAPKISHRHSFCSCFKLFRTWLLCDLQYRGRLYRAMGMMAAYYCCVHMG